ncbi:MAG: type I-B CRISPR-associated endonuclease Cas1b [Deltaproteobacteria bacterium]|nr:type I-B CRISPR-associated endonuclease Cas1b [Deltaproteobacteria bacterium]
MKRIFYLFSAGKLLRRANTLELINKANEKKRIPIEIVDAIYVFSDITVNSRLLQFVSRKEIPLYFFNKKSNYFGVFYPKEQNVSGTVLVKQVTHHLDHSKRLTLAKAFVSGAIANMVKVLSYYNRRGRDLTDRLNSLKKIDGELENLENIEEIMGCEGKAWNTYYAGWQHIITDKNFEFEERSRRPPRNPTNALISFGYSLLYTTVLSEIYKTQLNPTVSFLHAASTRRFSLALDLAEIFKPIIVDRLIFNLLNHSQITQNDFEKGLNYCYLKESGRKTFVAKFEEKLATTVFHPRLKRNVSYRQLIRLECFKLIKHLLGEEYYTPLKVWW